MKLRIRGCEVSIWADGLKEAADGCLRALKLLRKR